MTIGNKTRKSKLEKMRVKHFCTAHDTSRPFRRLKIGEKGLRSKQPPPKKGLLVRDPFAFEHEANEKRGPVNLF